jgi:hypothetical protein
MQPNWMEDPSEQPNKAAEPTKNVSVEDKGYPTGDIDEIWEPRPGKKDSLWRTVLGIDPPNAHTKMVNSDSFGHLPLAGGEEEANDFLRDKWEAHRRTSFDAANREKEVRSVVTAAGLSGVKSGGIYSVASGGKSGSGVRVDPWRSVFDPNSNPAMKNTGSSKFDKPADGAKPMSVMDYKIAADASGKSRNWSEGIF